MQILEVDFSEDRFYDETRSAGTWLQFSAQTGNQSVSGLNRNVSIGKIRLIKEDKYSTPKKGTRNAQNN